MCVNLFISRHLGREYLSRALSEENKRYRLKKISVSIKITFLTWALEFSVGVSVLVFWLLMGKEYRNLLLLVNWTIIFIILPCTYVLNREVTTQIIAMESWVSGIRSIFMSKEEQDREIERLDQNHNLN